LSGRFSEAFASAVAERASPTWLVSPVVAVHVRAGANVLWLASEKLREEVMGPKSNTVV